ncbi:MAG: SPFH domain-containing protein [Patescibacteria group bacterium]
MKGFINFLTVAGILLVVGLLFFGVAVTGVKPDAGYEAVLIEKPMIFGHGGVDPVPVKTGRQYVMWTTYITYVNMQPQQHPIHFEDFMSSEGVPLDFDAVIRLKVTDSVVLVEKFGPNWYENNIKAEFTNRVRQAVRKHGMNETALDTKAIDEIDSQVSEAMVKYIIDAKLPLQLVDVTVGKANPPDSVKNQRIETATQEQRINTEQQRKLAEDSRRAAELSRAAADNAYREEMELSPEQFLRLETIKMQREVCSGENPGNCTFVVTNGTVAPIVGIK